MMASDIDQHATLQTKERYNRIARVYDSMELMMEDQFRHWRQKLWAQGRGNVLEVGVGTGKNLPYYPVGAKVIAVDIAEQMLAVARQRAYDLGVEVDLREGDIQCLDFPDDSFDTVVATCVFCSVPDPLLGLREVERVVKPDGQILLLEHVRSDHPVVGPLMDLLSPLTSRLWGASINRPTVRTVEQAGLQIESIRDLGPMGIVKSIVARPGRSTSTPQHYAMESFAGSRETEALTR